MCQGRLECVSEEKIVFLSLTLRFSGTTAYLLHCFVFSFNWENFKVWKSETDSGRLFEKEMLKVWNYYCSAVRCSKGEGNQKKVTQPKISAFICFQSEDKHEKNEGKTSWGICIDVLGKTYSVKKWGDGIK